MAPEGPNFKRLRLVNIQFPCLCMPKPCTPVGSISWVASSHSNADPVQTRTNSKWTGYFHIRRSLSFFLFIAIGESGNARYYLPINVFISDDSANVFFQMLSRQHVWLTNWKSIIWWLVSTLFVKSSTVWETSWYICIDPLERKRQLENLSSSSSS